MQDTITKEITLKASKERVYEFITNPEQITSWFPDAVEGAGLGVGERPIFHFGTLKTQIYVEAAKPFDYFAYRWVPGGVAMIGDVLTVNNTLVEFSIEELPEGSKLTLKESGFASLPAETAQASLEMMTDGWDGMLDKLEKAVSKG